MPLNMTICCHRLLLCAIATLNVEEGHEEDA
jgi:hypothetical protein